MSKFENQKIDWKVASENGFVILQIFADGEVMVELPNIHPDDALKLGNQLRLAALHATGQVVIKPGPTEVK